MSIEYLEEAQKFSKQKLLQLKEFLNDASSLIDSKACVYATGSFGRLEAGHHSDLDLFIVSKSEPNDKQNSRRMLSRIDEIKLQHHLIAAVERINLPEFDGDGKFLGCHTVEEFVKYLGGPEDDYHNALTGRLLLLLESRPLIGDHVYHELISEVLDKYFVDFKSNSDDFTPAFLFNDILRMWRTFCVNYEYNRKKDNSKDKIKNLKLKYSRMLTCYSAIIYLLHIYSSNERVLMDDVKSMILMTPTDRIVFVREGLSGGECGNHEPIVDNIDRVLSEYAEFLKFTHQREEDVIRIFEEEPQKWKDRSYKFGEHMELVLNSIGRPGEKSSKLFRLVLI